MLAYGSFKFIFRRTRSFYFTCGFLSFYMYICSFLVTNQFVSNECETKIRILFVVCLFYNLFLLVCIGFKVRTGKKFSFFGAQCNLPEGISYRWPAKVGMTFAIVLITRKLLNLILLDLDRTICMTNFVCLEYLIRVVYVDMLL